MERERAKFFFEVGNWCTIGGGLVTLATSAGLWAWYFTGEPPNSAILTLSIVVTFVGFVVVLVGVGFYIAGGVTRHRENVARRGSAQRVGLSLLAMARSILPGERIPTGFWSEWTKWCEPILCAPNKMLDKKSLADFEAVAVDTYQPAMTPELLEAIQKRVTIVREAGGLVDSSVQLVAARAIGSAGALEVAVSTTIQATASVAAVITRANVATLFPDVIADLEQLLAEGERLAEDAQPFAGVVPAPEDIYEQAMMWDRRVGTALYRWTGEEYLFPYQRACQWDDNTVDYSSALNYLRAEIAEIGDRPLDRTTGSLGRLLIEGTRLQQEAQPMTPQQFWMSAASIAEYGRWHGNVFSALAAWPDRQRAFARFNWLGGFDSRPDLGPSIEWLRGYIRELETEE